MINRVKVTADGKTYEMKFSLSVLRKVTKKVGFNALQTDPLGFVFDYAFFALEAVPENKLPEPLTESYVADLVDGLDKQESKKMFEAMLESVADLGELMGESQPAPTQK